jgi:DNA-binding NarL/FixJ family response regulator
MLVEGLRILVNDSRISTVTGVSYSIAECRKNLAFKRPDVLLLDIRLPDGSGIDFCAEIRKKHPGLKILALTTHDEYSIVRRMMESGANGYILKNALSEEILTGIDAVMNGETFLCEEIEAIIKRQKNQSVWLTAREQELLRLVVDGYTNQEIADELYLGVETIKTYRKNLLMKLGAKNSVVLAKMAIEKQLI